MLGVIWQVIVAIFLLLPLTVSFIYSFAGRWTSILPQNLTFRFYLDKFKDSTFFLGILRGIFISALPVILVNIIILLTLFAVIVYFPKMEKIHSGLLYYSDYHQRYYFSNFDFVHLCRKRHHIFQPDYYADVYLLYFLPSLTYQGIRNSLYAVNTKTLLEAASILGANKFYGFLKIIVPTVLPGLMNTALISFSALFGDFAIIKIIASSQYETVQTYLYKNRNTDLQSFSAGVVILLVLTMIINLTVHKCAARNTPQGNKENRIK